LQPPYDFFLVILKDFAFLEANLESIQKQNKVHEGQYYHDHVFPSKALGLLWGQKPCPQASHHCPYFKATSKLTLLGDVCFALGKSILGWYH
jgi:hypothetical protein